MRSILLAGVQSGCGKTTVTLAFIQTLMNQGLHVKGFKIGPDFLDPLWHQALTTHPSYNIDTKMIGLMESHRLLNKASEADTHIAVIEGVMGLFDGRQGIGEEGSSAHFAVELKMDVYLIVDVQGMSGSIVPLVFGFSEYAKKIGFTIRGIIANRVGSTHHASLLQDFLKKENLPPLIAWIDKQAPELPERHLGLVNPDKNTQLPDFSAHFHLKLADLASDIPFYISIKNTVIADKPLLKDVIISIAKDAACCFIYPANIDFLLAQGAILHYFSPLKGEAIAPNTDAVWLPGGYPELYAKQLSTSQTKISLGKLIQAGKPVLAECGGMMLLGEVLQDLKGKKWPMFGFLAIETQMQSKLVSLGYRECTEGTYKGMRGHEFHHSHRIDLQTMEPWIVGLSRGDGGIQQASIKASYIHWYFASNPKASAQLFLIKT